MQDSTRNNYRLYSGSDEEFFFFEKKKKAAARLQNRGLPLTANKQPLQIAQSLPTEQLQQKLADS